MPSRRHSRHFASRYRAIVAPYTRRRFGGRHPSCGIGVTSRIAVISRPTACSERMAASRPAPGPRTKTSICLSPCSIALRAASSAAVCAANGVDLREPLKPALPALDHDTTLPVLSVSVTIVLLNVAWMWATPVRTSRRSLRLPPFLRGAGLPWVGSAMIYAPAFGAAAAAGAAGAAATGFFLTITPRVLPFRVRALVWVRCPRTGRPRRSLVPRVLADDPRDALSLDDLAVLTSRLDRRPNLHSPAPI